MPQNISDKFNELESKLSALLSGLGEIPDITRSDYVEAAAATVSSESLKKIRKNYTKFFTPLISSIKKIVEDLRKIDFSGEVKTIFDRISYLVYDLAVANTVRIFSASETEAKRSVVELKFYMKELLFTDIPRIKRLLSNLESDKSSIVNYLTQSFPSSIAPASAIDVIENVNKFIQTRPAVLEDQKVRTILNKFIEQLLRAVLSSVQGKEILFNINAVRNEWNGFFRAIESGDLEVKKSSFNAFTKNLINTCNSITAKVVQLKEAGNNKQTYLKNIDSYLSASQAKSFDEILLEIDGVVSPLINSREFIVDPAVLDKVFLYLTEKIVLIFNKFGRDNKVFAFNTVVTELNMIKVKIRKYVSLSERSKLVSDFIAGLKTIVKNAEKYKVGVAPIEDAKRKFLEGFSRYPVASLATGKDAVKLLFFFRESLKTNPVLLNDKIVQNVFFDYMEKLIDRIFESRFVESISEQQGRLKKETYKELFDGYKDLLQSPSKFPEGVEQVAYNIGRDLDALIRLLVSAKARVAKSEEVQKREANFIKNLDQAMFSRPVRPAAVVLQIEDLFEAFQKNLFFMKSYEVRRKFLDFLENRCRYVYNEFFYKKNEVFDLVSIKDEASGLRSSIISNDIDQQKRLLGNFINFIKEKIDNAEIGLGIEKSKATSKKFTPTYLGLANTLLGNASRTVKVISSMSENDRAGMKDSMRFLRSKLIEIIKTIDRIRSTVSLTEKENKQVLLFFEILESFIADLKKYEANINKYAIKLLKQSINVKFDTVVKTMKRMNDIFEAKVLATDKQF